jgi:uncharacterized iron-regulated protein
MTGFRNTGFLSGGMLKTVLKEFNDYLNFMVTGKKNQVMKRAIAKNSANFFFYWLVYSLFGISMTSFIWGCAVSPAKKLYIENLSRSFDEGQIISTKLGRIVTFDELSADLDNFQIIYVGESHTNAEHHNIQLEVIRAVYKRDPAMAVGMEMFAHTYQDVLDLWSAGDMDEKTFLRKVHWYANWRYDYSLYRGILDHIKQNHIHLVGLNIPFDIPGKIRVGGIENLRAEDREKLPGEIDTSNGPHREYLKKIFEQHHFKGDVEFEDFYTAQVVWDEAMAEMIARNLENNAMVVLAGNSHIQFGYGIPGRAFKRTAAPYVTIYLASSGSEIEGDIADYIWVTP